MAVSYPVSTLKASEGTWSTVAGMNADVVAEVNAGLTGDLEIRVENGASFSGLVDWSFTAAKFAGYTITLKSDIVTPASPGIISNTSAEHVIDIISSGVDSAGHVVIDGLILKGQGAANATCQTVRTSGFLSTAGCSLTVQNNLCYSHCADGESGAGTAQIVSSDAGHTGKLTVVNNTSFMTTLIQATMAVVLTASAHADSMVANNLVCLRAINGATVTTSKNKNNNVYAYDASNLWAVTGTAVNLTKLDPALVEVIIQSLTDNVATMAGRNAHLTASSTALIGQADPAYATATDIEGNLRT